MHSKILPTIIPLLFVGLAATSHAEPVPQNQRVSIDPPLRAHDPQDHPAPSASARLAERGGNIIRVGADGSSCDFDNLASALLAANDGDTILLEKNADLYLGDTYALNSRGVTIRGGYDDCLNVSTSGRTILNADGQGRVFDFWLPPGATSEMNVVLENLSIRGGSTSGNLGGGGILIEGRQGLLSVELKNVEVTNNEVTAAFNGGGIRLIVNADAESSSRMLTIDNDSVIQGNSTAGNGGGLACDNPGGYSSSSTIMLIGAAEIADNSATNGGGLALDNCRNVFIYNGGPIFWIIPTGAIIANQASENGGGIYLAGSSVISMRGDQLGSFGDAAHAAHIALNTATLGAGIYNAGLAANLDDVVINSNDASQDGGGIYTADGAITRHRRQQNTSCEPAESSGGVTSVPRCSRMTGNTATDGGGYYVANDATLDVDRTIITHNSSDQSGGVVRATADSETTPGVANFRDVLVYNNGGINLFYGWQTSEINVAWSTITDNQGSSSVFRAFSTGDDSATIRVISSIVWETSGNVLTTGGTGNQSATGDCLIGHQDFNQTDFDIVAFYSNVDPMLTTVDDKPYFPANTSPAIDYCDAENADEGDIDLVGVERGSEHQGPDPVQPPNSVGGGTYDIGAYETEWGPLTDELFQDRFEAQ